MAMSDEDAVAYPIIEEMIKAENTLEKAHDRVRRGAMATAKKRLTYFEEQMLFELRAIRLEILAHSKNIGKWLAAVAIAAASPADNTAEVQKEVDKITASLNASATAEEDALKQANQPKEN